MWQRSNQRFSEIEMNSLFKEAMFARPLYRNGTRLVLRKARQVAISPITIELYVTEPQYFEASQLAFFENILRSKYKLRSVPVKLVAKRG